MKYACIVLRNTKNCLSSVRYAGVVDAFLTGGVPMEEIVFLPYDAAAALTSSITRLRCDCDGIFLICDRVLCPSAKEAVAACAGQPFSEDYLLETPECLFGVLPANASGESAVRSEAIPRLDRRRNMRFSSITVRTMGAPAEKLRTAIAAARELSGDQLDFNIEETFGDARLEVIYNSETPKMLADEVTRVLTTRLEEYVYALEDVTLAQRLFDVLKLHRMKIATAESFTGGGVGRRIVEIPGASALFYEGLNTYDNGSKEQRLGVSPYTLKSHGAVSDEVAYEMAAGLIEQGNCDIAVATTGIAGPRSDNTDKPVGLCFIAVGTKERVRVYKYHLEGDRERITETAINLALFLAYTEIK